MIGLRHIRASRILMRVRRLVRNDQLLLSVLALAVGAGAGGLVVLFRFAIRGIQGLFYGEAGEFLTQHAAALPWWHILLATTCGGLVVGALVQRLLPGGRPQGVADVIEASVRGTGRLSLRTGLAAALTSAASVGVGGSVGREGPAVHLGATFGAWVAERLKLTRSLARTLLGCGAAAAVAASFNAPIAGALFAHEVVVGHYALSAFAPVVIASVTGTVISRIYFGSFPAFQVPAYHMESFLEFPAFALLGVVCGIVALFLVRGSLAVHNAGGRLPGPPWLRTGLGGLVVGLIALEFPQVLGTGYDAIDSALHGSYGLALLLALAMAKLLATVVSLGAGFAGGVFTPALFIGAVLGGAFGHVAGEAFPDVFSGVGAYAMAGMGALASAVLGAPISTTLIVFELTGDYELTMAVMVASVVASVALSQMSCTSFFVCQLEHRGVDLGQAFESSLLAGLPVREVMNPRGEVATMDMQLPELRSALMTSPSGILFVVRDDGRFYGSVTLQDLEAVAFDAGLDHLINAGDVARPGRPLLTPDDNLDMALTLMRESHHRHLPVVSDRESRVFMGALHERDVISAYNQALVRTHHEEHS